MLPSIGQKLSTNCIILVVAGLCEVASGPLTTAGAEGSEDGLDEFEEVDGDGSLEVEEFVGDRVYEFEAIGV